MESRDNSDLQVWFKEGWVLEKVLPGSRSHYKKEKGLDDFVYFHLIPARMTIERFPIQKLTGPEGNEIIISIKYFHIVSMPNISGMISK